MGSLKLIFVCPLLLAVIGVSSGSLSEVDPVSEWEKYKSDYQKTYTSPEEDQRRMKLFQERAMDIEEHNRKYAAGHVTWKKGFDKFTDWTDEEFYGAMANPLLKSLEPYADTETEDFVSDPSVTVLPELDWRERGAVTPVKYQGQCGSCYVFGSLVGIEQQHFLRTGRLEALSEQNIVDCGINSPNGCGGGSTYNVLRYIERKGIMLEKDYPYTAEEDPCQFDPEKSVLKLKGRGKVWKEEHMLEAIQTKGPLAHGINTKYINGYKEGVLPPITDCTGGDHIVATVGYGTMNGTDFYLVKNSWGREWGDEGYVRIPRGSNYCGIMGAVYYPILED